MTVDLRKHHPLEHELKLAEKIAWMGVVVMAFAIGEFIWLHEWTGLMSLTFSWGLCLFNARRCRRVYRSWPQRVRYFPQL